MSGSSNPATNNMDPHESWSPNEKPYSSKSYALSGRIMLTAILILLFVVFLTTTLHLYTRWYLLRVRRRQLLLLRRRRRLHRSSSRLIFHHETNTSASAAQRGLDSAVLNTLPLFVYSEKTHRHPVECAVCLSELEENETGRTLPKCNHSFHIECIDMWFHSHSTCPLCRSLVEPVPQSWSNRVELPETGSSSSAASGFASSTKQVDIRIDIPERSGNFNDGGGESPASQFRSPVMTRVLSFTRILSRDRRPPFPSPRSGGCSGPSTAAVAVELDVDRGREVS